MEQDACNFVPGCLHPAGAGDCHLLCVRILTQVNVAGHLLVYSSCSEGAVVEMPFARISHQSPHMGKRSFYHSSSQKSMPCCWREDFVVYLHLFFCTLISVRGKQKVFAHKRARYKKGLPLHKPAINLLPPSCCLACVEVPQVVRACCHYLRKQWQMIPASLKYSS